MKRSLFLVALWLYAGAAICGAQSGYRLLVKDAGRRGHRHRSTRFACYRYPEIKHLISGSRRIKGDAMAVPNYRNGMFGLADTVRFWPGCNPESALVLSVEG